MQRLASLAMAVTILAGCGERVDVTGSTGSAGSRTGTTGTSSGTTDARLVGQWSRSVLFQDAAGGVQSSRTTWRFGSAGSATRAVVTSNLTFGLVDSVVTPVRWRITGGRLALTFLPPASGDVLFDYRVDRETLILGGILFQRQ